jgi:hypothetical protein
MLEMVQMVIKSVGGKGAEDECKIPGGGRCEEKMKGKIKTERNGRR